MAIRSNNERERKPWREEFQIGFLAGLILIGGIALILLVIFFF